MTGAGITVKRNGKEMAVEIEHATAEERRRRFEKRSVEEVMRWMDLVCKTLAEHDQLIKQLRTAGLWDDAKIIEFLESTAEDDEPDVIKSAPAAPRKRREINRVSSPNELRNPLKRLLTDLDKIFAAHEEVGDTSVREHMREAVHKAFVRAKANYKVPTEFGMFSATGDRKVGIALEKFLRHPKVAAARQSLRTPEMRLAAFQDPEVESSEGSTYDEYFGHLEVP